VWGNILVNDELEDKNKSRNDIAKTRKGLVSEAMHCSSVSCPVTGICLAYGVNNVCAAERFRRLHKIAKSDYLALSCLSIRPSAHMEQLGCRGTDSYEI